MKEKKGIDWKRFAKLYTKLGVYRIYKHRTRFYVDKKEGWFTWSALTWGYDTLEEAQDCIFCRRYDEAKTLHNNHKKKNVKWRHP